MSMLRELNSSYFWVSLLHKSKLIYTLSFDSGQLFKYKFGNLAIGNYSWDYKRMNDMKDIGLRMSFAVETLKVTVFPGIFPARSSGINQKAFKRNFLRDIYWSRREYKFATDLNICEL